MADALQQRSLFTSACAGILVFGIVFAVLGTVFGWPALRARLHIDLAQQGNLFLLLYLGIFCASLIVGPLIDHFGHKLNLLLSSAIVALGLVLFAVVHSFWGASLGAVVLGFGGGGLNTCTNVLVSDVYGEQRGPMLNVLGVFFGVGAIFVPMLAAILGEHLTIPQLFLLCAAMAGVCATAYALLPFPRATARAALSLRDVLGVTKYSGIVPLALLLFLESGNEACIGGWTSTYVGSTGYLPRMATLVLAVFWAALMVSRLLAARMLQTVGKAQLVLADGLVSLLGCALLLSAHSLVFLFAGTGLIGLSYGPIFPTTLAIAGDRYQERAGTVFGFLFSTALLGGMLLPWAVGQFSQAISLRAGMFVPFVGAIGITALSCVMILRERHSGAISKASDVGV